MNEIIIVGAGGHARACIDVIEQENKFRIAGLIDKEPVKNENGFDYRFLGSDKNLYSLNNDYKYALVAIGQIKNPKVRINIYKILKDLGFDLPVIVSPHAYVSNHASISEGTIVMHGAIVNIKASIGTNCIINNKCLVEHDARIENHCHISTGAVINGAVQVGEGSFVGSGSVINQGVTIGKNCVVGSGVVVKADLSDNQLVKN